MEDSICKGRERRRGGDGKREERRSRGEGKEREEPTPYCFPDKLNPAFN
jgi:hypothetical protein